MTDKPIAQHDAIPDRGAVELRLSSAAAGRALVVVILVLLCLHVAVVVAKFGFGHDHLMGLAAVFDLNAESNVPTWYSAAALLLCAAAVAAVARLKHHLQDPFTVHWSGLAAIFVYMSLDEVSRFHEHWGIVLEGPLSWMRSVEVMGGAFRNLWVIPATVVAAAVGLTYISLLRSLPARTRNRFLASGIIFVSASVGLEMAGAHYTALGGRQLLGFAVLVTLEETLEMSSIVMFFRGVLAYIGETFGCVRIRVSA